MPNPVEWNFAWGQPKNVKPLQRGRHLRPDRQARQYALNVDPLNPLPIRSLATKLHEIKHGSPELLTSVEWLDSWNLLVHTTCGRMGIVPHLIRAWLIEVLLGPTDSGYQLYTCEFVEDCNNTYFLDPIHGQNVPQWAQWSCCPSCFETETWECPICMVRMWAREQDEHEADAHPADNEMYEYDEEFDGVIDYPAHAEQGNEDAIHSHDHFRKAEALSLVGEVVTDRSLLLGVELEVELASNAPADVRKRVIASLNSRFAYLKHDGSLRNGFEIVSQPATLAFHQHAWDQFFAFGKEGLKSFSTTTCGMHVHVSRKALTPLDTGKYVSFVNGDHNREFIVRMANRDANNYSVLDGKRRVSDVLNDTHNRYQAVNLATGKKPTIEVRIFKGTLNRNKFLANIDFCAALVGFVNVTPPDRLRYQEFIKWMGEIEQRKNFANLYRWLIHWGYLDEPFKLKHLTVPEYDNLPPLPTRKKKGAKA